MSNLDENGDFQAGGSDILHGFKKHYYQISFEAIPESALITKNLKYTELQRFKRNLFDSSRGRVDAQKSMESITVIKFM
jgi:hypothetical protein